MKYNNYNNELQYKFMLELGYNGTTSEVTTGIHSFGRTSG